VPNYADATSRRLLFQTNPFEYTGAQADDSDDEFSLFTFAGMSDVLVRPPRFTAEKREFNLYIPLNYLIEDDIRIALPEGYELEEASAPLGNVELDAIEHVISLGVTSKTKQVVLKRRFRLARAEMQASAYDAVKRIFDAIFERDQHLLTARKSS
jgi:hypothetical protein